MQILFKKNEPRHVGLLLFLGIVSGSYLATPVDSTDAATDQSDTVTADDHGVLPLIV